MKKYLAYIFIATALFYAGRMTVSPKIEVRTETQTKTVEKKVLQKVIREKVVPDPNAKEYYEKAFTLFLAAIGVKLTANQETTLEELIENPQHFSQSNLKEGQLSGDSSLHVDSYPKIETHRDSAEFQSRKELHPSQDLRKPKKIFNRSSYIKNAAHLKKINGEYRGTLQRLTGEREGDTDQVFLSLDFYANEDKITGEYRAELSSGSNTYSNTRGSGGNNDVRKLGRHLILETSPFAFIYFKNGNLSQGTFYSRDKFIGIVRLKKIN